jgi:hypothetical protein
VCLCLCVTDPQLWDVKAKDLQCVCRVCVCVCVSERVCGLDLCVTDPQLWDSKANDFQHVCVCVYVRA